MKKMIRIAVYNHKGGIGKTTIAAHLAYLAVDLNIRSIATCIDPQADLFRWLTSGDGVPKDGAFYDLGSLTVVYSRGVVPNFTDNVAELLIIDCSPDIDLSLQLKPDLWIVPVHGRMGFENMSSVIEATVVHELPVATDTMAQAMQAAKRKMVGLSILSP